MIQFVKNSAGASNRIVLKDDGQQCCEERYITCDDDLKSLVGRVYLGVVAKPGSLEDPYNGECHDTMFVEIHTSDGFATLCTHNVNNGYYAGFDLRVEVHQDREPE